MNGSGELHDAGILVVDDNDANSELIREILVDAGYRRVTTSRDAQDVPRLCRLDPGPDLLILDLHMPVLSGFEIMAALRDVLLEAPYLPVLVITADVTLATRHRALSLGAHDFLTKPVDATEVLLRARNLLRAHLLQRDLNALVAARTQEVELARLETLERLALAAEYRDDDTNHHTRRVGSTVSAIAGAIGLEPEAAELLVLAAPLHDVGKIGIPDSILLKPGPLSAEELVVMRRHVRIGADILSGSSSPVLIAAEQIARFHHERWDGRGYLEGLAGGEIPLGARITAVADVFDALTHERPYKHAWSVQRAVTEIINASGTSFDPAVVDGFRGLDHAALASGNSATSDLPLAQPGRHRLRVVA